MTIQQWIQTSDSKLFIAGISTSRLDCIILLEDIIQKDRSWILANPDIQLEPKRLTELNKKLRRRISHEPLAYIRGKTEFYGRNFIISKDTLEPRPESETIIEQLKKIDGLHSVLIADIGTGSGALAITIKLEIKDVTVIGTDISKPAIQVAKKNVKAHNLDIGFYQGDLLEPLTNEPDILVCNLPYVPDKHTINKAAMQEPPIAIFGGPDGLDLYRKLFFQINQRKWRPKYILTESLPPQHPLLKDIASQHGYAQKTEDDFIQVFESSL